MIENKSTPSKAMEFLWFCAGVNTKVLKGCPASEHNKMAGIGAAVLFTGMLAALSGGYALYVAWQSPFLGVMFGLFWGVVIFNLDRFMVATLKRGQSFNTMLLPALPRVLLAVVLALVIAKPLELRIFQSEINEVLEDQKVVKLAQVEERYQVKIAAKEQAVQQTQSRLDEQFQIREDAYQAYRCECDGTCGTGKRGRGSECERKERRYLQADQEYQEVKKSINEDIVVLRRDIEQIKSEQQTSRLNTEDHYSYGLVARLAASERLPWAPRVFIPILILLVELSPILVKLLAPTGPYEAGLEREEQAYRLAQEELLHQQRRTIEKERRLQDQIDQAEIQETVAQRKRAIQALSKAQLEITQKQISDWLAKEKSRRRE